MFIMNPMAGPAVTAGSAASSPPTHQPTHPPTAQRIARLDAISARINGTPSARPDERQFREL